MSGHRHRYGGRKPVPPALCAVFHPLWSPRDDYFILTKRAEGVAFERIAIGLMRDRLAIEQRWHRLRVIPGIEDHLKTYGLTATPYPAPGGFG